MSLALFAALRYVSYTMKLQVNGSKTVMKSPRRINVGAHPQLSAERCDFCYNARIICLQRSCYEA